MKTIIEKRYLHFLEEEDNPEAAKLPVLPLPGRMNKRQEIPSDPFENKKIDKPKTNTIDQKDSSTSSATSKESDNEQKNISKETDIEDTTKDEDDMFNDSDFDKDTDEETEEVNSKVSLSQVYKLRNIYSKMKMLASLFLRFSNPALDSIRSELNEAMYLFQKVLIPNLDSVSNRLDEIIKNYQKMIKRHIIYLQRIYENEKSKMKTKLIWRK